MSIGLFVLACRTAPAIAPWVLFAASAFFCLSAGPVAIAFLSVSIVGNYLVMKAILGLPPGSAARRGATAAAILANLAPLVFFKVGQQVLPTAVVLGLPLGLAFYTLQQITFLVEAQKPAAARLGLLRFATWGSFFGQLPAGPIAAYGRMAPQYVRLGVAAPPAADIARGLTLVLAGVIKKTWLADPMARKVDAVLVAVDLGAITPLEAWTAAWSYMLQLYFDFSAYSDIAIGAGLCFGLLLPVNFNSPLKAATPGQYVMRWHISLMTFVRDYVFEPVFRIARRLPIKPTSRRYGLAWALATLIAFLAVAAWHTAAPLPLLQGLGVALLLITLQYARQTRRGPPRSPGPLERRIRRIAGQALLLGTIAVIALMLRVRDGDTLAAVLSSLFDVNALASAAQGSVPASDGPGRIGDLYPNARLPGLRTLGMMAAVTALVLVSPNTMQIFALTPGAAGLPAWLRWKPGALWGALAVALLMVALIGVTRPVEQYGFIYAQF